jgi:hypothetical protein
MRFLDRHGSTLIDLPDSHATRMRSLARKAYPNETGGILIGHYDEQHRTALVRCLTGAPRDSISGPFEFRRGVRGLESLLTRAWRRGLYYLGEWHFHREVVPSASWPDQLQMSEFARVKSMQCPEPLLLIVGLPDAGGNLAAYIYKGELVRLNLAPPHVDIVSAGSASTLLG